MIDFKTLVRHTWRGHPSRKETSLKIIYRTFLLCCVSLGLVNCANGVPSGPAIAPTQARFAARTFAQTCLQTALDGRAITGAFQSAGGFSISDRPLPGPRTVVYDGPAIIGVVQGFAELGQSDLSCAIYANVADMSGIHTEVGALVSAMFPAASVTPLSDQASQWRVMTQSGQSLRIVSARLGPRRGAYPIPGNIRIIAYQTDQI